MKVWVSLGLVCTWFATSWAAIAPVLLDSENEEFEYFILYGFYKIRPYDDRIC